MRMRRFLHAMLLFVFVVIVFRLVYEDAWLELAGFIGATATLMELISKELSEESE